MKLFLIIFGLSSGIMVGAGVISLLILVGIIPRMAQLSNTRSFINFYEKFKHVSCLPPVILLKIYCSFVQMKYTTFSPKYTRHTKGKLY